MRDEHGNLFIIPPQGLADDVILREIVEETIAKSHRQWRSIPETAYLVLVAIEDYLKAPRDAYEGKGKRAYYSARADLAAFNGNTSEETRYRTLAGQLPIEVEDV